MIDTRDFAMRKFPIIKAAPMLVMIKIENSSNDFKIYSSLKSSIIVLCISKKCAVFQAVMAVKYGFLWYLINHKVKLMRCMKK